MIGDPGLEKAIIQTDPRVAMALIALFSALVAGAAVTDLRRYIIPNWISAAIALLWCLWALVVPGNPGTSLLIGLGVFAVGTVLFAFRAFGGGDVKLLAAVSLWAGSPEILTLIFQIAIAGGVVSILWVFSGRLRLALAYYGAPISIEAPTQVPYGLAIAAGGLLMAARLAGL